MDDLATAAASLDDLDTLDVDALEVMCRVELAGEELEDPELQRLLRLDGREETIHRRRVEEVLAILGQR